MKSHDVSPLVSHFGCIIRVIVDLSSDLTPVCENLTSSNITRTTKTQLIFNQTPISSGGQALPSNILVKDFYFMALFYGWGPTASSLQPLRGGSLLFTIQFSEIPGTHFIDLGRMKG